MSPHTTRRAASGKSRLLPRAFSTADSGCHGGCEILLARIMNERDTSSKLARRFVEMGLSQKPPEFPEKGIPLVQLVPWWRLWPRDPQHNCLFQPGAAMFPVIAEGIASLQQGKSAPQAVFAALLPIHLAETSVAEWTKYTICAGSDVSFGGPAAPATVLEFLLEGRADGERLGTWRQVLEGLFVQGQFRFPNSEHGVALLECVGRSGLRVLAPLVCQILESNDGEMVLAAIACLARLGVPDGTCPAETLLTRLRAEMMDHGRAALAFVESGDIDRLDRLLGSEEWPVRVQGLRLAEAVLNCAPKVEHWGEKWLHHLIELLLTRLQGDQDRDVVRCLATTLGLALKCCSNPPMEQQIQVAGQLTHESRFESLLNAVLIAGLPNSSPATQVEALRGQSVALGGDAVRALNRLMMALGEPGGCVFDWLNSEIVAIRQTGVLRLPDAVQDWFDCPQRIPEVDAASWLRDPGDSDLASMFCAAYLIRRPTFLKVLEQLWIEAAYNREDDLLELAGGLLAGAGEDCGVSPAELRICLGHEAGGPLPQTPENAGRLLGLALTQKGDVRESAEALLLQMPNEYRTVAGGPFRWLSRNRNPFARDGLSPIQFGGAAPGLVPSLLPIQLQLLFATGSTRGYPPHLLLETMICGGGRKGGWAGKILEWDKPEEVQAAFNGIDSAELATAFLRISSSPHSDMRVISLRLAAGVGPRLLQPSFREKIIQRLLALTQDSDTSARAAVARAAQSLGVGEIVPIPPPSASTPNANTPRTPEPIDDPMLEELLAHLEGGF